MKQTLRSRGGLCPKPKPIIHLFYTIFLTFTVVLVSCVCSRAQVPASSPEAGPAAGAVRQAQYIRGTVLSATKDEPLEGATVKLKHNNSITLTDENGDFSLQTNRREGLLEISFLGYVTREVPFSGTDQTLTISLEADEGLLEEVMVSTGYQEIPKERATGSFVQIGNELLNRKVGANLFDRLKDAVPGMLFDTREQADPPIQIRGLYTLKAGNARPLVIVDNFPYEEDIRDINPNDVESITVLKDAAAASIWGARAGNGVVVITTKKGKYNRPLKVSVNVNTTLQKKPDLFQLPLMAVGDYIDVERFLFDQGYGFSDTLNYRKPAFSPVYELLFKVKNGEITKEAANAQIMSLKDNDIRTDYGKYLYRNALGQQYAISLNGGTEKAKYFFSLGYDKSLLHLKGNGNDRLSFRLGNTVMLSKKLELQAGLMHTGRKTESNSPGEFGSINANGRQLYPYAQLVDEQGRPAALDIYYRKQFTDTAGGGRLLDWKYRPLDELAFNDKASRSRSWLANVGLKYALFPSLTMEVKYRYQLSDAKSRYYYSENTYRARDLINKFTQIEGENLVYPLPNNGILDLGDATTEGHSARAQVNFNREWNGRHALTAIAGGELRQDRSSSSSYRTYGFDERLSTASVNYLELYPTFGNVAGRQYIPNPLGFDKVTDRYVSLYANAAYTLDSRYTISGSVRKDATNLFGVKANQRWKPLWSAGFSWKLSDEGFYKLAMLPYLRLRATYGYSGNVDRSVSSFVRIAYRAAANQLTNIPFASIAGAPNPELRWEQVNTFNTAVDFGFRGGRVNGTFEYYRKKSMDVLGNEQLDPTTGIGAMVTNSANLKGSGFDFQLQAKVVQNAMFNWNSNFYVSQADFKITRYLLGDPSKQLGYTSDGTFIGKLEGYSPYALVSYRWAGLDSGNGDPLGYLDGALSRDYRQLIRAPFEQQVVHASALPRYFGGWMNTVNWKGFSLSANLSFRLGYYFRRPTLSYDLLFSKGATHSDYAKRWQQPGDEKHTTVPSMVYPADRYRSDFYGKSDVTVEKADHIRLEDIRLSYDVGARSSGHLPLGLNALSVYAYLADLNLVVWKANKAGIDPMYPSGLRPSMSMAFGIKADF